MATVKYKDKDGNLIPVGAGLHTHSPSSIGAADRGHIHDVATATNDGFLSSTDKEKIDNINDSVFGNTDKNIKGLVDLVGDEPVSEKISDAIGALTDGTTAVAKAKSADTATTSVGIYTSGTGDAYTATVPNLTSLRVGVSFVMIPHVENTSNTPTLNVNKLGAKGLRRKDSRNVNYETIITSALQASKPVRVVYDGTYWVIEGISKPVASDIDGTVSIAKGGTGATSAAAALVNLGLTALATELNYCDGVTSNIQTQLDGKVDTVTGKGLSTNDYTTAEKNKLAGIDTGANKTVVDSALSETSTNPVQNKVVYDIDAKIGGKPVSEQISEHAAVIVTQSISGHMSAADKIKLNNIPTHNIVEEVNFNESNLSSDMSVMTIVLASQ